MSCSACATIVVMCNGDAFALHAGMLLANFLQQRGFDLDQPMACAVNLKRIEKVNYHTTPLNDGDRVDVVTPSVRH